MKLRLEKVLIETNHILYFIADSEGVINHYSTERLVE